MSTLTGNKISLTYKSIIKTSDNDVLTGTLKQLSDGLGNNSGVYLNTGGDLKSTGTLEFANFKGTSTSVTINKLVNQADGISSNDNDTSLPTSAAVKDYVDTHVTSQDLDFSDGTTQSAIDLDSQVFSIVGTTNEIDTVASGQQLQIGLPNSITISGTYTGTTFSGDLNGTINTATTAVTQAAGNNSTKVATTAYVDTLDAASDLDFSGTSGTGDINLNTQTFAITGAANQITTAASNQGLVISLLSSGVTLPNNSVATTQSAGDNSTKVATTAYVDVLDAASDLDIAGDSGTGDVNLNTQTFTLSGTTNQVTTAVSGQSATFSLPSTVHRNLQGNVTGNLTGNADTATKWATARNLSLTSEATGTISSVDGSGNVSGAVTLLNSAVTGKVLTGLPTPAAGNIQAGDSILEAFGKLQSQVSSISNGLIFKGSWDAATNTPTLTSGGGEVDSGTTTGQTAFKLIETGQNFNTTVTIGDKVINQVDGTTALVTVIDSNTQLTLDADIMLSGEAYTIDASPFIPQGNYYVVNYAGTTNLNGITDWSIGDWVIADADNRWSKLDHSQVDGQGTPGHLPVFATATTIGDSIVAQSGTALTVTGSLNTTLGASVTGDFAVNTNKFTVNATSGNATFAGDLSVTGQAVVSNGIDINGGNVDLLDNVRLRVGTASDLQIYHDGSNSYINDLGTGNLEIRSNFLKVKSPTAEDMIWAQENAGVTLFHNNVSKLTTTSTGVSVTGTILAGTGSVYGHLNPLISATDSSSDAPKSIVINNQYNGSSAEAKFIVATYGNSWHIGMGSSTHTYGNDLTFTTDATSSNSPKLRIATNGNATFAGDVTMGKLTATKSGTAAVFNSGTTNVVASFTSTDGTGVIQLADSGGNVEIGAAGNDFVVQPAGGVAQLTVGSSSSTFAGNVLVGSGTIDNPQGWGKVLQVQNSGANGASLSVKDSNNEWNLATYNGVFNISDGVEERLTIDSSGNVGIGNTNPSAFGKFIVEGAGNLLNLNATSGKVYQAFYENGVGRFYLNTLNGSDGLAFTDADGSTERMRITANGSIYNSLATNTHFGLNALSSVTTADESTAFGNNALRAQQTGRNTAVGYRTLQDLSTGNYNTVVGGEAAENITTGDSNVAVGSFALRLGTTVSASTALGYQALYNATDSSNNTAVGSQASFTLTTGTQNTSLGWNALYTASTSTKNVAVGSQSMRYHTGTDNTAVGAYSMGSGNYGNGAYNVSLGAYAGYSLNTGASNTFIGNQAGYNVQNGANNIAIGQSAMYSQTSAGANVAIGRNALYANVSGANNVAIGDQALTSCTGSNNTAVGLYAGLNSSTGASNTFMGTQTFQLTTTGGSNVGMGVQAGYNNTVGIQNTYIGYAAGYGQTGNTGNANTAIGNYSQKDRAGGSGNTSVGHYALGSDVNAGFNASDNTAVGTFSGMRVTSGALNTFVGYNAGERITSGGNNTLLGRGAGTSTSPSNQLTTESNRVCLGNNSVSHFYCKISTITTSDKRDKTNFGDISYGLDFVNQLKPTAFEFKKDGLRDTKETDGVKRYGFLAQDILELEGDNPVIINNDDKENLKYQESHLVPVLVKAIQELKAEVDKLKQECKCK